MSERERWIVYPLLFFALGAALRDKFTQQVRTDRLHAGLISCEELVVLDAEKPDRIVAKLSSNPPQRGNPNADRYGVFLLIDSEGQELCQVRNNQLVVNQIGCKNLFSQAVAVVDPRNPGRTLALLTAATAATAGEAGRPNRHIGSLMLTDSDGQEYFGLADDQLKMRRIVCEGIDVVDPENPGRPLAGLASEIIPAEGENPAQRQGVLVLNNQRFANLSEAPAGHSSQDGQENEPPIAPEGQSTEGNP